MAFFSERDTTVLNLLSSELVVAVHPVAHPSDVDFSPDGSRLVVKGTSGRTVVLDAQTGRLLVDFRNRKEGEGSSALFSSCGRYVVSVSWDGLLSMRDSSTGELAFSCEHRERMLNDLSAAKDRRFFVYTAGEPPPSDTQPAPPEAVVLHPWPIQKDNGRELPQRWPSIETLQVSPSGRLLAVVYGASPKTLEIFDIEHSRVIASRVVEFGRGGDSVGWSPDESFLAVNGDHRCLILEVPTLITQHDFALPYLCHVGFSPSSRFLALGSWETSYIVPLDHLPEFAQSRQQIDKPPNRWIRAQCI